MADDITEEPKISLEQWLRRPRDLEVLLEDLESLSVEWATWAVEIDDQRTKNTAVILEAVWRAQRGAEGFAAWHHTSATDGRKLLFEEGHVMFPPRGGSRDRLLSVFDVSAYKDQPLFVELLEKGWDKESSDGKEFRKEDLIEDLADRFIWTANHLPEIAQRLDRERVGPPWTPNPIAVASVREALKKQFKKKKASRTPDRLAAAALRALKVDADAANQIVRNRKT